jgi:hypothetical protein
MEMTNDRLAQLLSQGRGVFPAGEGPLFLADDGSLLDNSGAMLLPPDPARAAIAASFAGFSVYTLPVAGSSLGGVKNGGTVAVDSAGKMTVPGIVALRAVTDTPPASPKAGEKYGNTTDGKIYKASSGSWVEATGADAPAAGILYAAEGLLYHWNAEDGFQLI